MKHLGDITKISGAEAPRVEVVIGGSPCQDLSVAGKRAGLAGARSGLFMEQIRLIKEMREHDRDMGRTGVDVFPRFMVFENVPGLFSSNGGEDFRAVLEEICRVANERADVPRFEGRWRTSGCIVGDGWSLAWRVHDTQFWGVPQRRRRICLVADFAGGSAPGIVFDILRGGASAVTAVPAVGHSGGGAGSEVYFVGAGLRGDPEESGEAGEGASGDFAGGVGKTGGVLNPWDAQSARIFYPDGVFHTLNSREKSGMDRSGMLAFSQNQRDEVRDLNDIAGSLAAEPGMKQQTFVVGFSQNGSGDTSVHEKINAITTNQNPSGRGMAMILEFQSQAREKSGLNRQGALAFRSHAGPKAYGMEIMEEGCPTLTKAPGQNLPAVFDARGNGDGKVAPTMTGDHGNRVTDYTALCIWNGQTNNMAMAEVTNTLDTMHDQQAVIAGSVVRRLTPLEAERLQGYPDGWTDIGDWTDSKGRVRKSSDAARYRVLGNSIALSYWRVMLSRLIRYCREGTMASLFDGIGGFPLCWHQVGGRTLWASEIEEFPIAVTKRRFGED